MHRVTFTTSAWDLDGVRRKAHGNRSVGTLHVRAARFPERERARERVGAAGQTRENRGITARSREKVGLHTDHRHGQAWEDTPLPPLRARRRMPREGTGKTPS